MEAVLSFEAGQARAGDARSFRLKQPGAAMRHDSDPRADADHAHADLAGLRIVVAEDNWLIGEALKTVLERHGAIVAGMAASVTETRVQVASAQPDLVIADLNLQSEPTTHLIGELTSRGIPVVVITGYPEIANECGNGRMAMLRKPVHADAVIAAIRRLLGSRSG
ncbi:MAG: hypothetical protein CTY20_07025 [Hyphomicrobium sp.]|nr:MAG: hypothetical protein CTY20_07025 [Hyphomicrobium sp.]